MLKLCQSLLCGLCLLTFINPTYAERPDDSYALANMKTGKAVFDVNMGSAHKLASYLKVIQQTVDDLVKQNVQPDIILAFRGGSVKLVSTERDDDLPLDDEDALDAIAKRVAALQAKGVRTEACSVATVLLDVPNDSLLKNVIPVGNTFVSLIGYQAKGYAVIPIY